MHAKCVCVPSRAELCVPIRHALPLQGGLTAAGTYSSTENALTTSSCHLPALQVDKNTWRRTFWSCDWCDWLELLSHDPKAPDCKYSSGAFHDTSVTVLEVCPQHSKLFTYSIATHMWLLDFKTHPPSGHIYACGRLPEAKTFFCFRTTFRVLQSSALAHAIFNALCVIY